MNISLVTPAAQGSRSGNRATAERVAHLLRECGHRVQVARHWQACGSPPDLLVAVHAYRSAAAVRAFQARHPGRPVIVVLAGTDVYRFQHTDAETTLDCLDRATRLVGLHDDVAADIPARFASRVQVIHQSAPALPWPRLPPQRSRELCVIGHLREEKDPLRAAFAVRCLPAHVAVRVHHLGRAHDRRWALRARAEEARNARYVWHGEVDARAVQRTLARSRLMVISSRCEGGANVVSQAVRAGLPILASDVPGNRGLLGRSHPGYFPVGNTRALSELIERALGTPAFLRALARSGARRSPLFTPCRERDAWRALVEEL